MAGSNYNGIPVALVASATLAFTSSTFATANLKDSLTPIPVCDAATFILDVTMMQGVVANGSNGAPTNCLVVIDTSPDGGTTWYPAYEFTQVTGSSMQQRLDVRLDGIGITEVGANTSLGVGSTTAAVALNSSAMNANTCVTRDIRVRAKAGSQVTQLSMALWGIFSPAGRHGF